MSITYSPESDVNKMFFLLKEVGIDVLQNTFDHEFLVTDRLTLYTNEDNTQTKLTRHESVKRTE